MADETTPPTPPTPPTTPQSGVDQPSPQVPAPLDPIKAFNEEGPFREGVLKIAKDVAQYMVSDVADQARAEAESAFIASLKAKAIKEHLGGVEELAALLPDVPNIQAMDEVVQKLCTKLRSITLHDEMRSAMPSQTAGRPTAADLIEYGLKVRRQLAARRGNYSS